ncbi:MAG: HEAT repeat domain-containing protein [Nitrospirae bacterium]|nr:HEAT repeat domain-containing protein [Nitrospirota bacterium]MCL5423434.1 HEAT repeat domain-containing protein [Nitrospirota bacterium]
MPEDIDIKTIIADYMGKGFLENIIDMFKHDRSLYPLIGELMADGRIRVRLGISALVETLAREDPENIVTSIPSIVVLLKNENPTIRGDAVYLLGMVGHRDAVPFLVGALDDENSDVREFAREAIEEIEAKSSRRL